MSSCCIIICETNFMDFKYYISESSLERLKDERVNKLVSCCDKGNGKSAAWVNELPAGKRGPRRVCI